MSMERPTPTIEDYLGVIYTLERDGESVIGARLADWLEVSPPTVTATVKRMVRDGWVTMDRSKEIHLTADGREAAQSLLRRHMLAELLLARILDVPWSQVHQEAEQMRVPGGPAAALFDGSGHDTSLDRRGTFRTRVRRPRTSACRSRRCSRRSS